MAKDLKKEIITFFKNNPTAESAVKEEKIIEDIYSCLPKKITKGIKDVFLKNHTIIIKTTTPSWRQEIIFLKKEIMKKIHKNFRNYRDLKITIL